MIERVFQANNAVQIIPGTKESANSTKIQKSTFAKYLIARFYHHPIPKGSPMTFLAFLFTGVVWMANGSPMPPVSRLETSLEACKADAAEFAADVQADNDQNPPTMQLSWHTDCRAVMNGSEATGA